MEAKETKKDRFTRLAEPRINAIFDQLRKLGNLSNTRNYEYTDEQVDKMFTELSKAVKRTRELFEKEKGFTVSKFKF